MRRDSFNVLFFIKKTKLLKNGEAAMQVPTSQTSHKVFPYNCYFLLNLS